jgi:hypothetical protein
MVPHIHGCPACEVGQVIRDLGTVDGMAEKSSDSREDEKKGRSGG